MWVEFFIILSTKLSITYKIKKKKKIDESWREILKFFIPRECSKETFFAEKLQTYLQRNDSFLGRSAAARVLGNRTFSSRKNRMRGRRHCHYMLRKRKTVGLQPKRFRRLGGRLGGGGGEFFIFETEKLYSFSLRFRIRIFRAPRSVKPVFWKFRKKKKLKLKSQRNAMFRGFPDATRKRRWSGEA